ncbi:phage tail tape measure protein [Salmonella enterica]|nr:phage tail tape measure protein [Salmonella enterica]
MAGHFDTQIGIGVKDNASVPLQRIRNETVRMQQARERVGIHSEHTLQREIARTEAAYNRLERSGKLSATELARAHEKTVATVARLRREMEETEKQQERLRRNPLGDARERLGIRSEQTIRREMALTEAAYNRLERSGELSAAELARAYARTTDTISKLRRELGETERTQSRLATGLKTTLKIGAGAAALTTGVAAALADPVRQQMDYDTELRRTSNFMYRNGDVKTRLQGVKIIDDNIRAATRVGGGSPEEALAAAEVMARSKMSTADVYAGLPAVMKIHTATGAGAASVGRLMTSAFGYGLTGADSRAALDAATTASQHGLIDVPLLAREAPRGLELARGANFHGRQGFADLMALYEVGAAGAGTPEEGATNINDLMLELTSQTLADNAKTVKVNGRKVNWRAMVTRDAQKGHNALYTLHNLIGRVDDTDPVIRDARKRLAKATTPDEREKIQGLIDTQHGQNVSKFLRNQQALKGYLSYERYLGQFNEISSDVKKQFDLPEEQRSTSLDFAVMKDSNKFKSDQAANEKKYATMDMASGPANLWGGIAEKSAELAKEFPVLAEAVSGVSSVFSSVWQQLGGVGTTLATIAGVKLGAKLLKGRTGKPPVPSEPGVAAEAGAETAAEGKSGWLRAVREWMIKKGKTGIKAGGRVLKNGAIREGLLDIPGVDLVTGVLWPSDTVSGEDERNELARLKTRNRRRNGIPDAADALQRLQNWNRQTSGNGARGAPVITLPELPAPKVSVRVLLDSHDIASVIEVLQGKNSRRYGA